MIPRSSVLIVAASFGLFDLGCQGRESPARSSGQGGAGGSSGGPAGGDESGGGAAGPGGTIDTGGLVGSGGAVGSGGVGAGGTTGTSTGDTTVVAGAGGTSAAGGTTTKGSGGRITRSGTGGASGSGSSGTGGATVPDAGTAGNRGSGGAAGPGDAGTSQWPQCFSADKMPSDDAVLKQRAPSSEYAAQITFGGVAMLIGPNRHSCLTDTVVDFDVKDLNGEIRDVVETLQFPGFLDWARGYYLNWVILNSGIPGATISGQGGHQGDRWGHMNFESSEECPCNWGTGDNSNRGNALHESIHALQAELWAFNNQASGWIHEAHNCYLGTQRAFYAENKYTMGWGAALALQMPHVPIESMGLLTDDTVAGPSDQLANGKTYVNSIVRYGLEIFFLSLNLEMGRGFINCMWIDGSKAGNPDQRRSSTKSVFQMLQSYAGEEGGANAVMAFGTRSAILDYGGWTDVVRSTLKSNWKSSYWFYTFPGGDGTTTFSPPTKTIPHHQGRNIIPIKVASGASAVTVEFAPDAAGSKGTAARMQAQLVYRDSADQPVYGARFASGQSTVDVAGGARNGIVNLVVGVTNPNGTGAGDDGSGKGFDGQEHFNYKARIVSGGTIAPTSTVPW